MKQWYKSALKLVSTTAIATSMLACGAVANADTVSNEGGSSSPSSQSASAKQAPSVQSNCTLGTSTIADCFPDPSFAQAVADAMAKDGQVGDIFAVFTQESADSVTSLQWDGDANGEPIRSLEGAQYLHKVATIDLSNNDLSDLTPLKGVTRDAVPPTDRNNNVRTISVKLQNSNVSDVTPLTSLKNVGTLWLQDNPIEVLPKGISGMSKLTDLELGNDQIADLSPISGMPELNTLSVADDLALKNIKGLKNLPKLTRVAFDNDYNLSDLTGIGNLEALNDFSAECGNSKIHKDTNGKHGSLSDISPLAQATNLTDLNVSRQQIKSIEPLAKLHKLTHVYAPSNQITDLSPLKDMKTLASGRFTGQDRVLDTVAMTKANKWTLSVKTAKHIDSSYVDPSSMVATYANNAGTMNGTYNKESGKATWKDPAQDGVARVTFEKNMDINLAGKAGAPKAVIEYSGTIEQPYTAAAAYKVTFDSKGGSAVPTQNVHENDVAVKPTDPTYGHNKFNGWYLSDGTAYDFSKPVTKDVNLTAKWTTHVSVSFDLNYEDAPAGPATQTVDVDGTATKPDDPQRAGYVFKGWSTQRADGAVYDFSTPVTKDTKLYAQWERQTVKSLPLTGGAGIALIAGVAVLLAMAFASVAVYLKHRKLQ